MHKKLILIIGLILILTGCGTKKQVETLSSNIVLTLEQQKNIDLRTQKAEYRDLDLALVVPAQFKAIPLLTNRVYAPVDGKIAHVYVVQGQTIKNGQPLVLIQSDAIGQIESELLQNIIQITSEIKMSQSQLEFARNNYRRESSLLKEKITSRMSWEDSKTQMNKEMANLSALRIKRGSLISVYQQRLNLYGADNSVINKVLATNKIYPYITLRAHKNGIVIKRDANQEEFIILNKELFEVADLSKIWLSGNLFEQDINTVRLGDIASAEVSGLKKAYGKITYVAPSLDIQTKTLEVIAEIENKELKLKPNMYAQMKINIGKVKTLAIPKNAIQKLGDADLVYVRIKPNTFEERRVEVGIKNDKYAEIKRGLNEGDIVVTNGSFSVLGESIKKLERE